MMKKILTWIDTNLFTWLALALIVVVPLYPKIPLADVLPGYIVRVRLDDILMAFAAGCYVIQLLRKKVKVPPKIMWYLFGTYVVIGFISSLSAVFITHTVTTNPYQLLKLAFHWARRIEYFSLFFVVYAGIRNRRDVKRFLLVGLLSLVGSIVYGFGQKYLYWPAFSTMNREFSKGMMLYLTPQSRVMSTFGGHYDYAAYLMMSLGVTIPAMWIIKNKLVKMLLGIISLAAYWSLLLTASRTSWGGYIVALAVSTFVLILSYGWKWGLKRYVIIMTISMVMMLTIGDMSERFYQIIQSPATLHQVFYWIPEGEIDRRIAKAKDYIFIAQQWRQHLTEPSSNVAPPKNSISTDELAQVATPSDTPPQTTKPLPPDVTQAEDDLRLTQIATTSGNATASATTTVVGGGYSANALKYGLSAAIRLDALWPLAVEGFKRNPLLGSGYSTLTKSTVDEFTEAESTDNDYLRMLGETGLLGTISFLAILAYLAGQGIRYTHKDHDTMTRIVGIGMLSAVIGLLVNATYIDVFESSKVAYTLWMLAALCIWLGVEKRITTDAKEV